MAQRWRHAPHAGAALLIAVLVLAAISQILLVRTFTLLGGREKLVERTQELSRVAGAQRQAVALVSTLERAGPLDRVEYDTRLELLLKQTSVIARVAQDVAAEANIARAASLGVEGLTAFGPALTATPEQGSGARVAATATATQVDAAMKQLYKVEESEVFESVADDIDARQQSQFALAGVSALTVVCAGALIIIQRRRSRSSVDVAYAELVSEVQEREVADERFTVGFEQSATGAVLADLDGVPFKVNASVCAFLGRDAGELVGRRWTEFSHPEETGLGATVVRLGPARQDSFSDERRYVRPDGSIVWALSNVTLVRDARGQPSYYFAQFQDITDRKAMEAELRHRALHDTLTGLPNRSLLADRLEHALARAPRHDTTVGVIFLDLDRFKLVNDAMGHAAGDVLVRLVALRLKAVIRPEDTLARFGGDEFVVLCEGNAEEIQRVARRVFESLGAPFSVHRRVLHVGASVGVVVGEPGDTAEQLLQDADVAMYKAKDLGRGRIQAFDAQMRDRAEARFDMEGAMRRALENDEFEVFYQPVVDLQTEATVGAEALVRWRDPDRGLIAPIDFIPLAEETGLVVALGATVLDQATRAASKWRSEIPGCEEFFVAVNVSARQLETADFAGVVQSALLRAGLAPSALHLEVTESVLMDNVERAVEALTALKRIGVHLSIDDFGTGYSSLAYLKQLPVDTLKIDRSFIDGLGTDADDSSIVGAIVSLGTALGLELVAEGVETECQWRSVRDLGCQRAQGYLWSRPVPVDEFIAGLGDAGPVLPDLVDAL